MVYERQTIVAVAGESILQKRQEQWEEHRPIWTHVFIRDIHKWTKRKWGEITYEISQALTGTYLYKFKKRETNNCIYCGEVDTPRHTIFECDRWKTERDEARKNVGKILQRKTPQYSS